MTIRQVFEIGIPKILQTAKEFGIDESDDNMSMSLGSGLVKLIDITNVGIIANGGKIQPNFIQSIMIERKISIKKFKKIVMDV